MRLRARDAAARRLEGELREAEARALLCGKCGAWLRVGAVLVAQGRCGYCHRLLDNFR